MHMGEQKVYEKPQVVFWKAEQLDAIEATMSVGGGGGGTPGREILIPAPYGGGGFSVTFYDEINWSSSTPQRALYNRWGRQSESARWDDGIATYRDCWLIACTSTFGAVGDILSFLFDDGTYIPCIMADEKNQSDSDCNKWGHADGQLVLEFEVSRARYEANGNNNPGRNSWKTEWAGKRVIRAFNFGYNVL